jgi:hypothetical protein
VKNNNINVQGRIIHEWGSTIALDEDLKNFLKLIFHDDNEESAYAPLNVNFREHRGDSLFSLEIVARVYCIIIQRISAN